MPSGIWYLQLMFPQAVQQAFSTFFLYATFDRFPRLRLVVLECGRRLARLLARPHGRAPRRARCASRSRSASCRAPTCAASAGSRPTPTSAALPPIIDYVGADRFLWATDYPHSDHGADYMDELGELAAALAPAVRRGLVGGNAMAAYRLG